MSIVDTIVVSGSTAFLGGDFGAVGGEPRSGLAAVDLGSGRATSWNPGAASFEEYGDEQVYTLALAGSTLYAGGDFSSAGGLQLGGLAAVDATTHAWADWSVGTTGEYGSAVNELLVSDGTLYLGGYFEEIGGKPRANLAAINLATGEVLSWNPGVLGEVSTLARRGSTIYVGGDFERVGGQARQRPRGRPREDRKGPGLEPEPRRKRVRPRNGRVDGVCGRLLRARRRCPPPLPRGNQCEQRRGRRAGTRGRGAASTPLLRSASRSTSGGSFSRIGGAPRNGLAALDAKSAKAGRWNPDPNGEVSLIEPAGDTVFVAGDFQQVGGKVRAFAAALNAATVPPPAGIPRRTRACTPWRSAPRDLGRRRVHDDRRPVPAVLRGSRPQDGGGDPGAEGLDLGDVTSAPGESYANGGARLTSPPVASRSTRLSPRLSCL